MRNFLVIFCLVFLYGCSSYKTVGNFKYKTHYKRSNIGEFEALIKKYEVYVRQNDTVFPVLVKAQKLDFETKNDTVYAYGKLEVLKEVDETFIIVKEININGYEKFANIDSIVRMYEQFENGKIVLKNIYSYKSGVKKVLK